MTPANTTPASVLFRLMKEEGGVSNKELAGLILSDKPLSDGRSPQSRIGDRTWVSRFIVHAPVGSLTDQYFCDYALGALRLTSRMKSREKRALTGQQIVDMVCGEAGLPMDEVLNAYDQNPALYRNMLTRIASENSLSVDQRAEVAMVLLVTAACTADVRRAVVEASRFVQETYGGRLSTPSPEPVQRGEDGEGKAAEPAESGLGKPRGPEVVLGLLQTEGDLVVGVPQWLEPTEEGTEIGSLALAEGAVNAVGPEVSGRHARIWRAEDGSWYVEDLGSKNGTIVTSGLTGAQTVVAPSKAERGEAPTASDPGAPVPTSVALLAPGDQLTVGSTTFLVIQGPAR